MFTGIIESIGEVVGVSQEESNVKFSISSDITSELKIDQSVSHNGVCLTVVSISGSVYEVVAISETLSKSNLGSLEVGSKVNLERAMKLGARLDGHLVQGHVDGTATCISVSDHDGSWEFRFRIEGGAKHPIIEKGSICINGVSLTLVNVSGAEFSVAIIPYTYEHTNFSTLQEGTQVNIEFDMIGKYVEQLVQQR